MQLKPILAAAGLTATATTNALLLPPDVSVDDIITTLPVPAEVDFDVNVPKIAQAQNLKLNCPGCPVRVFHHLDEHVGEVKISTDTPSHLELDFSIQPSEDIDRLMLNGYELYPKSDPFKNTLTAALLPEFGDKKMRRPHHFKGPRPLSIQNLGFGLQTRVVPSADSDDALELVVVDLQIIEVGNAFVDGIPNVEIKLVKTPSGKLMIADLAPTASETVQETPMDAQEECTTTFCKWLAMAKQQFGRFRSGKHCGGRPAHASQESGHFAGHRPHHPGHLGHGHHHHEFKHSWKHLLRNIATQILLPVAIGIMAGVTASVLGMMVGTFVVYVWRTFVRRPSSTRRRHRGHGHSSKAAVNEAVVEEEKSGLMAHQEEPDVPPAYVEEGVVVNDDKKPEDGA
ncbi:hypothetical protein DL764_000113 [Monosporascus ibericus]|uniref:DUF7728 domain-containing protein n=1 Tax=Monosporascus ibericus TaxID=155417 RepID=A0A4Q4TUQ6_9PEZI|nr:hypothetical protein DL764_000113 [Monosporascus ibericus]